MGRRRKPDPHDQARRLAEARTIVKGLADAMPNAARELRREACEIIDDVIAELARAPQRKAAE